MKLRKKPAGDPIFKPALFAMAIALVVGVGVAAWCHQRGASIGSEPITSESADSSQSTEIKVAGASDVLGVDMSNAEPIKISGKAMCLPHKDQSGPQTLECAFGLLTADGKYYALRDSDPTYKNISGLAMGKVVQITGLVVTQSNGTYPIVGVISVTSATQKK